MREDTECSFFLFFSFGGREKKLPSAKQIQVHERKQTVQSHYNPECILFLNWEIDESYLIGIVFLFSILHFGIIGIWKIRN